MALLNMKRDGNYEWDDNPRPLKWKDWWKEPGDWSVPGFNYMGPGNKMDKGPPTARDDAVSLEHDWEYGKIEKEGLDPMYIWSDADQKFIDEIKDTKTGRWISKPYFQVKKLAYQAGLIDKFTPQSASKKRKFDMVSGVNRRVHFGEDALPAANAPVMVGGPPLPHDDDDMGEARVAAAAGSGTGTVHGKETPITQESTILRPFPQAINGLMPYYKTGSFTIAALNTAAAQGVVQFRMNSPYDILVDDTAYTADPAAGADTRDTNRESAMMYGYYSQIYKYFSCLKSHWRIRFWTVSTAAQQEIGIWKYYHGKQNPPYVDASSNRILDKYRMMHRGAEQRKFPVPNTGNTDISAYGHGIVYHGNYVPGMVDHEVAEDNYTETWHAVDTVPSLREAATYIVNRTDRSTYATEIIVHWDLEIVYDVQWKDLKAEYEFPSATSDISITNYLSQTL